MLCENLSQYSLTFSFSVSLYKVGDGQKTLCEPTASQSVGEILVGYHEAKISLCFSDHNKLGL